MTRYITLAELLRLYCRVMELTGESGKVQSLLEVELCVVRPRVNNWYHTLAEKAAAFCGLLARHSGFSTGSVCVAHAALETMLVLNGFEIDAPLEEQEHVILAVSEERLSEHQLAEWLESHSRALTPN